jgi:Tol biopolymer transport system component
MRAFSSFRLLALALLAGAALQLGAGPAEAEYFGRNKVQYRGFHFEILRTQHFDIYFYAEQRPLAMQAGRMAERWYTRLSRALGYGLNGRQALILYASHPDFEQTNAIPGELSEGTGGVTEAYKRRIVLPLAGPLAETDHVIGHELVHAFQFDVTGQRTTDAAFANPAILRLPLWFIEGMAEYFSVGPLDPNTAMWIRDAAATGKLPTVRTLGDPRFFPYRYGQAFWTYVASRWGEAAVARCLRAAGRAGDAEMALTSELGIPTDSLSRDWHRAIRAWYAPLAAATEEPDSSFRAVAIAGRGAGELNVAPAVSPDGRSVVFFSEKDLFSIELYMADLDSGRIARKLTRTAVDPHLQSLQFIQSAGAWSQDGRRFAFPGVANGRPLLTVIDARSGRREREVPLRGLGEVLNPTWSPDGQRIAFAALAGGQTDLFWVDLGTRQMHRLTDDLYGDLHPTWSPDGATIAFATDRFSTDLDSLRYGRYELALLDVATGAIRRLGGCPEGKNINPQWARDGRSLYFVSDARGIANVYRIALPDGGLTQITNLRTGVSGITDLSPAISVARDADRLVFTAYERSAYNLYAIDSLSTRADRPALPPIAGADPGALPVDTLQAPADFVPQAFRPGAPGFATTSLPPDSLAALRPPPLRRNEAPPAWDGSPTATPMEEMPPAAPPIPEPARIDSTLALRTPVSLPDSASFTLRPYRSRLSLDYIAQPNVTLGATTSGLVAGGGAAAYWSDMLGDHNLATFLQVYAGSGGVLRNSAAGAAYENRHARWNWGVTGAQVPLITRGYEVDQGTYDGQFATRYRDYRVWEIHRVLEGTLAYPLSRVQRLETFAGFSNIDFAGEVETQIYSDETGELLFKSTDDLPENAIPSLNFVTTGAALVYDTSVFGGTSPVLGQRYRFEGTAALGSINYVTALVDYRRYVPLARSLILAGRVMHFGRYGSGSDDPRLEELFLGYASFLRGYDDGSFDAVEVGASPVYRELFGSRLAVANFEVRVPLLGALGVFPTRALPPLEFAAFVDAGVAWSGSEKAWFAGGSREPLTSYGAALRLNLLGFAIGEVDLVHPNDRPGKGWYWEFSLTPGF